MNQKIYIWIAGGVALLLIIFIGVWFFFLRGSTTPAAPSITDLVGTSANNTTGVVADNTSSGGTQPLATSGQVSTQKIFEITAGPIAGATLIQTLHPTTTLARYVDQEDGHVYDLPLDVPGAVPRVVSNVTIPGASRVIWLEQGNAAVLQYIDTNGITIKSVYLGLPLATTSTATVTTRIQFLPDNIIDLAASPDGASVVYLLKTPSGADGYTAHSDGTGAKKLFSLPLSQVLVSWPAPGTFLAESKSAAGVPGIVFSIDAKSGAVTPALYAQGVTAIASPDFTNIIYQTVSTANSNRYTYAHSIKSGGDHLLSFSPIPEKCIWSSQNISVMYCASPLTYVPSNYLDLWHQGTASVADSLFSFNLSTGQSSIITTAGGPDGGTASDILEMALSPDEHYLSFTTKGVRALWGVRLTQ